MARYCSSAEGGLEENITQIAITISNLTQMPYWLAGCLVAQNIYEVHHWSPIARVTVFLLF